MQQIVTFGRQLNHQVLSFFSDSIARQARIHSYTKSFNAFAANLLPDEVQKLKGAHFFFFLFCFFFVCFFLLGWLSYVIYICIYMRLLQRTKMWCQYFLAEYGNFIQQDHGIT